MSEPLPPSAPSPQPSTSPAGTAVIEQERVVEPAEPGDHERFAHYVKKDKIVSSAVTGEALTALCGKVWVPSRDPKRFPVCPTCKEIFEGLRPGKDSGGDGKGGSGGSGGSGSDG
ncbi:DUF3039 domain-containing protein [Aquipuribacter sp. MA13-6]|uniref:DUF3039 domain-containing protein n=1 Tax=unclassified Aquipuribacter TaxID=2635084 RepID=UPI003EEBEC59